MFAFDSHAEPVAVRDCLVAQYPDLTLVTQYKNAWVMGEESAGSVGQRSLLWFVSAEPIAEGSHVRVYKYGVFEAPYRDHAEPCIDKFRSH